VQTPCCCSPNGPSSLPWLFDARAVADAAAARAAGLRVWVVGDGERQEGCGGWLVPAWG
jgi:hypothetical protein